jgi:cytochrome P450
MLENADENDGEVQAMIRDLAGVVYLAGADTTVAAVISFFLAAVMYPEMQKRAQTELDAVVGRNRLPEFQDQDRLPYVKAVMSECLRWLPLVPFGESIFGPRRISAYGPPCMWQVSRMPLPKTTPIGDTSFPKEP